MLENVRQKMVMVLALALMPLMISAQSTLDIANQHKILLDTNIEVADTVTYAGSIYHVIKYNNVLPYASGIEIFSSDGTQVTDPKIAKSVLTQTAWKEAAAQISPSDIDTLREILDTSRKIHDSVAPVASATSFVIDKVEWLRSEACVNVPFVGKKCAWDAVKAAYPGISTFISELESLNKDLNEWKDASAKVSSTLPEVISGLEDLRAGKEMSPELQTNIQESMSAFVTLKTKTDDISSRLTDVISILSDAESSLRSAAGTPVVGGFISTFADYVDDLNDKVKSLREDARSFSRSLSEQSTKLSNVMSAANKRADELYGSWNSRRNAPIMVYSTLGGIIAVILAILGVLIYKRRRKGDETGVKVEKVKREEKRERIEREKVKIPKVKWSSRKITGIIIAVIGLFLLLHSFITANDFVGGEFMIDETFGVRIIFFIFMIGIGGYLIGKGATLAEDSKIIGIILTPFGLFMLCFTFVIANTFVNGEFMLDELFFIKILFFFCMIGIGGYLTGKGVTLTDSPKITGLILTPIGVFMLLFSFITANNIVGGEFITDESFIISFIFFICMIGIGLYLTGRGTSEIMKR